MITMTTSATNGSKATVADALAMYNDFAATIKTAVATGRVDDLQAAEIVLVRRIESGRQGGNVFAALLESVRTVMGRRGVKSLIAPVVKGDEFDAEDALIDEALKSGRTFVVTADGWTGRPMKGIWSAIAKRYIRVPLNDPRVKNAPIVGKAHEGPSQDDTTDVVDVPQAPKFHTGGPIDPTQNRIPVGTYTFEYEDGTHRTFRVRDVTSGKLKGQKVVEFLAGPDNTIDFQMFGRVYERADATTINVWRRFEGGTLVNLAREIESAIGEGKLDQAGLTYALKSSRCRRCNRVLTVPASIHQGYGPDCIGKVGL